MIAIVSLLSLVANPADVSSVSAPPLGGVNTFYGGNRSPLEPAPFRQLPIRDVHPEGWILKQLQMEASGFVGHLTEISEFLQPNNNAWLSPKGIGDHGWEELPYWLRGFGDLGYVLHDKRIITEANRWLKPVMESQRPDGWFGPVSNLTFNNGHPDEWPNMLMLNALQSSYEYKPNPAILTLMERYFKWELAQPDKYFLNEYWAHERGADNELSVLWLYNKTGDKSLLSLMEKIHKDSANWSAGVANLHGVNIAEDFREPAEFGELGHLNTYLADTDRDYHQIRQTYGQVPGAMYGADENARPGDHDPRQATETCAMVEMMHSSEWLVTHTGQPQWAARCESVAFNDLPAAMTANEKGLHYLTAPNLVQLDNLNHSPGIEDGGPMLDYDPNDFRCCQHNVSMGWPYYAEHLWLATDNNGLGAVLYGPSRATATVGDGAIATVHEVTNYPFSGKVSISMNLSRPSKFPFVFRIPDWCRNPSVRVNGISYKLDASKSYATLQKRWKTGDVITLDFPMTIHYVQWPGNGNSVSLQRGPLFYSLKIGEKVVQHGGTKAWPAFNVYPTTPWNVGLVKDGWFKVIHRPYPASNQPYTLDSVPIEIQVHGRAIPQWKVDRFGLVAPLQPSPALTHSPETTLTLVPMGAARLRISEFPTVVTHGGHPWAAPTMPKPGVPAKASYLNPSDSLDALTDGDVPTSSADQSIPRFTWWNHLGTKEWVELDYPHAVSASVAKVYWFDDRVIGGGCRIPAAWRLSYWSQGAWVPVSNANAYPTKLNAFSQVAFTNARSKRWRIDVQLQPNFSGGILEWQLKR